MGRTMPPKPKTPRTSALFVYRNRKRWTQAEMAAEFGVRTSTYQRLEALPALTGRYKKYALAFEAIKAKHGKI